MVYAIAIGALLLAGAIKNFSYKFSWHYNLGRVLLALCFIFFGYNIFLQGQEFYVPLLHAWRRMLIPDSKNRINETLTYEELFGYITQAVGVTFCIGGFFILVNFRKFGGFICILAVCFMMATQDNPLLIEYIKPKPRLSKIRYDDLCRHISLIGALLYMMVTPAVSDIDPEAVAKAERKQAKLEKREAKEAARANKKED